ncbi:MAG: DNA glycosylase [Nitrosopumilaceae archaeon]|nr:DNA glycosylase [Nitrosopumilaceae archaeon]
MVDFKKIDLDYTINSGQVFLWKKQNDTWYGINGQNVLCVDSLGKIKSYREEKYDFLRKKDNLKEILQEISKDRITKKAVKQYFGLRLLRQDPFQCLISFIISSNSNIQKIKFTLENLCKKFGKKIIFENTEFFLFPEPKALALASIHDVWACGAGYRSKFIIEASKMVFSKKINLNKLKKMEYSKAKEILIQIPGVGNKVADCILLFSLDKLEAFPLDRWMIRILEHYFPKNFQFKTKTITDYQYDILHEKIVDYFGPYCGYTQQFLFKMERENHQKKWL